MPDGVDARTTVSAEVSTPLGPRRFAVSGTVVRVLGWRALYGGESDVDADVVPGKAKRQDEVPAVRLPAVDDDEEARATGAEVVTAVTEPPRRITRGELPVVMGRLIDQVDDPAAKRALENPANPNEPKGLGTAATRDTMLPKLVRSHYIALQKGKDPAIEVTDVGLAFLAAVRRVFPAYGDPVGRAMFEADLGEIGRATSRGEAERRADAFRQRTRERVGELIEAISRSAVLDVDADAGPVRSPAGDARPPTSAMIAYAVAIADRKGLKLPRGLKSDGGICRTFLDEHGGQRAPRVTEGTDGTGTRRPTPAMLRYAETLARQLGTSLPSTVTDSFTACQQFLDANARSRASRPDDAKPAKRPRDTRQASPSKRPSVKGRSGSTGAKAAVGTAAWQG